MFGTLLSNFEPVQSSKRRLAGQGGPRQTHAAAPFDHGPRDAELTPRGLNLPPLAKLQHPQQPSPLEPHTVPSPASDAACPRAVWRDHVDSGATEATSPCRTFGLCVTPDATARRECTASNTTN